jgi:hypothetical protein
VRTCFDKHVNLFFSFAVSLYHIFTVIVDAGEDVFTGWLANGQGSLDLSKGFAPSVGIDFVVSHGVSVFPIFPSSLLPVRIGMACST